MKPGHSTTGVQRRCFASVLFRLLNLRKQRRPVCGYPGPFTDQPP
jgi:hypothetical protein